MRGRGWRKWICCDSIRKINFDSQVDKPGGPSYFVTRMKPSVMPPASCEESAKRTRL